MFTCHRPLTLPNFLDTKKPVKSSKYSAPFKKPYVRPPKFHSNSFGSDGPSSSSSLPVHGHDFMPLRGSSGGAAGYSYGTGLPNKNFDDYHDGPSSYHVPSSDGPKSFVSMSSNLDEDEPDEVINIDHGRAYDPSDDQRYQHSSSSPYGAKSSSHYQSSGDPLHPLRNYHASDHDNEHMYDRLRQEYQRKSSANPAVPLSPYFQSHGDYNEPSSTSVQSRRHDIDADGGGDKLDNKKAYWSMSYTQDA